MAISFSDNFDTVANTPPPINLREIYDILGIDSILDYLKDEKED